MRIPSALALFLLAATGGLDAQLTSPVGRSGDVVDVGQELRLPSQIVAAQISAALADPRNQALLDSLESALAGGVGTTTVPAEIDEVQQLADADEGTLSDGSPVPTEAGSPETVAMVAASEEPGTDVPTSALATPENTVEPDVPGTRGALSWLRVRLAESRAVALRAATTARGRLAGVNLPGLAYWIPAILGILLLVGVGTWRLTRPTEDRSFKRARKLARRGVGVAEVARRTGLSRDLIQLIEARRNREEVA